MPLDGESVKILGLDDLRKELKKLDEAGLIDQLKDANYEVATMVVAHAATKAAALGRMEAKAATTMTASRQAARAQINAGGTSVPFFGGAEFGAGRNVIRSTTRGAVLGWNQFVNWTGSGPGAGRFLYGAIRDDNEAIVDHYGAALDKITKSAFPD